MRQLLRRLSDARPTAASGLVLVLVASLAVAGVLAYQAISAARQRQAVSEAMLRQYAQLAAWEFSREARRETDKALSRALAGHVHAQQKNGADSCDCVPVKDVEHWFELVSGVIVDRSSGLTA